MLTSGKMSDKKDLRKKRTYGEEEKMRLKEGREGGGTLRNERDEIITNIIEIVKIAENGISTSLTPSQNESKKRTQTLEPKLRFFLSLSCLKSIEFSTPSLAI